MSLPQGEISGMLWVCRPAWEPVPEPEPAGPKTPLTTREIVDTLDRLRVLELEGDSPWPDLGDGDDTFPVDWRAVETETASELDSIAPADEEPRRPWDSVEGELRSRVRPRGGPPPTVLVDALAWYQPIHYFGHAWGIYIRESAVSIWLAISLKPCQRTGASPPTWSLAPSGRASGCSICTRLSITVWSHSLSDSKSSNKRSASVRITTQSSSRCGRKVRTTF